MRIQKCYISDEAILSLLAMILICFYTTVLVYGLREALTQDSVSVNLSSQNSESIEQQTYWPVPDEFQLYEID